MLTYSALLTLGLVLSSPWWLLRMVTTERYREGLRMRLGAVPAQLLVTLRSRRSVWVHAVSVGEVLAASRLVDELDAALGEKFRVVISTTTRTGQALARERFGAERVFYMPLDFAFAVRAYLRALKPAVLILMESELWPRMLYECSRASVPVAVVNARVSDRSFARAMRVRRVWGRVLRRPSLWLAQSAEDGRRLIAMGARSNSVQVAGNLKYDIRAPRQSRIAELIHQAAAGRPVIVAGSTMAGRTMVGSTGGSAPQEEEPILEAWSQRPRREGHAMLVIAPRHPERFQMVESLLRTYRYARASEWSIRKDDRADALSDVDIVLLDTIGDLASTYGVASAAFIGGSLVKQGGHNPLEPARFGVPVVIGPSFENFRDVVAKMQQAGGIRIVQDKNELETTLIELLTNPEQAKAMGERGRSIFEQQQGATARAVKAILALVEGAAK